MKRLLAILVLGWTLAIPAASAGTIRGTVVARGKEGADADLRGGKYASRKFKFVQRVDYAKLRDFLVYVDHPFPGAATPPVDPVRIVVQKDATFSPHVLAILVGTTVEWPNEDDIFHNVFSMSDAKKFDLGLYKQELKRVTFDQPGRVDVFCSIHSAMYCVIWVMENPFFAVTDAEGRFEIHHVPAGRYPLKAWHERLPVQERLVDVPEEGVAEVDIIMGITGLPEY